MEASVAVRHKSVLTPFVFIQQLRSLAVGNRGAGCIADVKAAARTLAKVMAKAICFGPVLVRCEGVASPFSCSSKSALDKYIIDLMDIPEISGNEELGVTENSGLKALLIKRLAANAKKTQGTRQNLALVELTNDEFLDLSYRVFLQAPEESKRKQEFRDYNQANTGWLDEYVCFTVLKERFGTLPVEQWPEAYRDFNSPETRAFMADRENADRMNFHRYVQMETERQVKAMNAYLESLGITEREVLAPVGVDRASAEAFFHPRLHNILRQIGCFAEPENGYGTQLWGIISEINDPALLRELLGLLAASVKRLKDLGFTRNSLDHACGRLGGYTTFDVFVFEGLLEKTALAQFGDKKDAIVAALAEREYAQDGGSGLLAVQFNGRRNDFKLRGAKGLGALTETEETRVYELLMKSGKFRKLNGTDNKDAEIAEKSGRWMFDPRGTVTREEVVEIFGTEDASWHQFFINPNNFLGDALIFKAKAKEGDREYSIEEYIMLKVSDPTKKIGLLSMLQRAKQDVEKRRAKYAEQTLAAILELAEDVAISAETVGDFARRVAAEKAISKAIEDGHRVTLMRSLPYESNHFTEGALPLAKLNGSKELGAFAGAIRTALAQEEYVAAKEKNDEVLILDKLYATKREDFDLPSVDFGDQNREEMLNKVWFLLQESRSYIESDRLSFTHDMFALLTHLTGFVGTERKDWMFANHAAHVRKVLNRHGILTAGLDAPLNVDRITPEFMLEFLLRGRAGSDAGTVVYTEPTLHCLDKRHIANVNQNCVNVNPGVRGDIDNDSGNWLQHSDPIERVAGILVAKDLETVVAEPERQSALWQALAKQQMIEVDGYGMAIVPESAHVSAGQFAFEGVALTPFEKRELEVLLKQAQTQFSRFYALVNTTARYFGNVVDVSSNTADTHFQAQVKQVKAESVVYQAANGNWTTWEPTAGIRPILEMAVAYTGPEVKEGVEGKSWTTYSADTLGFEIDPAKRYAFRDLAAEILHTYVVDGKTLLEQGLAVGLNTKTSRHHFVVYEKTA